MNLILQYVDDTKLIRRISSAGQSVALYAPGVSVAVARALCAATCRLQGAVKAVLDVSQKSVDMGYLDPEAAELIWRAQQDSGACQFFHLPGLRLGSLFVDDKPALVYAPVSKLMEDEYLNQVMRCLSGLEVCAGACTMDVRVLPVVAVDEPMVAMLRKLHPAKSLSAIKAECAEKLAEAQQRVEGAEKRAQEAEKRATEAETRAVEKYKAQFKIRKVEFSVRSQPTAIGRKRASIPSMFLVGVGNEAEKKLLANYRLFPDEDEIDKYIAAHYPQEGIAQFAELEESIRNHYLLNVPRFGSYVRSKDIKEFKNEVDALKQLGKKVGQHIREALSKRIDAAIENLYKILEAQWARSRDPWYEEFRRKHPKEARDRHAIFVAEMKAGTKGTDALIEKFIPAIDCFSTPIDEALADNEEFMSALCKMLCKRNHTEGKEKIQVEDLITLSPKTTTVHSCPYEQGCEKV